MNIEYRFIEPLDVLFLRGNQLFGDPGSYGESLIPPWPSVAAGAIRSRMLVDKKIDVADFAEGEITTDAELGTPEKPGSFTLAGFYLARQQNGKTEILVAPPADLVISKNSGNRKEIHRLAPTQLNASLLSSYPLAQLPVLAQGEERSKPESGYWLTQTGWEAYLNGETPTTGQLVHSSDLWSFDPRVGIGMSAATRSVEEGKLFSAQAVALKKDVGFVAAVDGAQPPHDGLLRFGGDGRAASIASVKINMSKPDYDTIVQTGKCRLVLTSPGLFPDGWKLPSAIEDNRVTLPSDITARLVSAAVPRAEIVSGWDLANKQPKPAQRVTPTGSVYWLDNLHAKPDALRKLVENGLWGETWEDKNRCAEGFNRIAITPWR